MRDNLPAPKRRTLATLLCLAILTGSAAAGYFDPEGQSGTFTAEYRGALYAATYGKYALQVSNAQNATIFIDETAVSAAPAWR